MKKLKTHIKGLDDLFHGGIQVDNVTYSNSSKPNSIIIVVRGESGTNKHLFAMQLMHGLTRSIVERLNEKHKSSSGTSCFYSINKSEVRLNDMYLDLLITRWIDAMTNSVKLEELYGNKKDIKYKQKTNRLYSCRVNALRYWFDEADEFSFKKNQFGNIKDLITLLANNVISYNPRTNSIHYRRVLQGDSSRNCILKRISDDWEVFHAGFNQLKIKLQNDIDNVKPLKKNSLDILKDYKEEFNGYSFPGELINVEFNYSDSQETELMERYSHKAHTRFFEILRKLESISYDKTNQKDKDISKNKKSKKNDFLREVVVIDGFSHVDSKALRELPYNHLLKLLHEIARVSILVFDERKEPDIDADIIIDLRKSYDTTEEYAYQELQITKCFFQTHAFGWHQYKCREEGIVVFPSIHLLLSKRNYIPGRTHDIGKPALSQSFAEYCESKVFGDNINGVFQDKECNFDNYFNKSYNKEFQDSQTDYQEKYLNKLISEQLQLSKIQDHAMDFKFTELTGFDDEVKSAILRTLNYSLFGDYENSSEKPLHGWNGHLPATAIVGNPNSYKRKLVNAQAMYWVKRKEHVLFILLDKKEPDSRRNLLCPAICSKLKAEPNSKKCDVSQCLKCYQFVHFLPIRPGCISADEFFSMLSDQIKIYCDENQEFGLERRRLHIIIDDFQRIDFCFPFLKSTALFTDILINICQDHAVQLTILCDKSSIRKREVCTLANNVICVERNESDINNISLYLERTTQLIFPSAILKFEINDVEKMFVCNKNSFRINPKALSCELIGSMKEYWRQSENIIIHDSDRCEANYSHHN